MLKDKMVFVIVIRSVTLHKMRRHLKNNFQELLLTMRLNFHCGRVNKINYL